MGYSDKNMGSLNKEDASLFTVYTNGNFKVISFIITST